MGDLHPTFDDWYLPLAGVDPPAQGRGLGSTLYGHAFETCGRDGLPAYLEATAPRNRDMYARHGFDEIGVIQQGGSPPMWRMLRQPRQRGVRSKPGLGSIPACLILQGRGVFRAISRSRQARVAG